MVKLYYLLDTSISFTTSGPKASSVLLECVFCKISIHCSGTHCLQPVITLLTSTHLITFELHIDQLADPMTMSTAVAKTYLLSQCQSPRTWDAPSEEPIPLSMSHSGFCSANHKELNVLRSEPSRNPTTGDIETVVTILGFQLSPTNESSCLLLMMRLCLDGTISTTETLITLSSPRAPPFKVSRAFSLVPSYDSATRAPPAWAICSDDRFQLSAISLMLHQRNGHLLHGTGQHRHLDLKDSHGAHQLIFDAVGGKVGVVVSREIYIHFM